VRDVAMIWRATTAPCGTCGKLKGDHFLLPASPGSAEKSQEIGERIHNDRKLASR
jgi:hypothetical protein